MIFGVISIAAIGYFFVTLFSYTYNYISLRAEEKKLQNELVALQDEKGNLKIEIEILKDAEYVARYAKENFLYSFRSFCGCFGNSHRRCGHTY